MWDKTKPENDQLLTNFPASQRGNNDALELGTDASLLITNAKCSASMALVDTKLAQITTAAKVSGAAITLLTSVPAGAGVLPAANSPNKLKADASDTTPQYLDSLIDTGVFQVSAGDLLQLKDSGVETVKLKNGSASPGNSKYYGTNSGGTKGFFDVPDISAVDADTVDGIHAAATPVANKLLALDVNTMFPAVVIPRESGVVFSWGGSTLAKFSVGAIGATIGGTNYAYVGTISQGYDTVLVTKFLKASGINTVRVYTAITGNTGGNHCKVTIAGATPIEFTSGGVTTSFVWGNDDIDVSGLVDGTVYDVTVELKGYEGLTARMAQLIGLAVG